MSGSCTWWAVARPLVVEDIYFRMTDSYAAGTDCTRIRVLLLRMSRLRIKFCLLLKNYSRFPSVFFFDLQLD